MSRILEGATARVEPRGSARLLVLQASSGEAVAAVLSDEAALALSVALAMPLASADPEPDAAPEPEPEPEPVRLLPAPERAPPAA